MSLFSLIATLLFMSKLVENLGTQLCDVFRISHGYTVPVLMLFVFVILASGSTPYLFSGLVILLCTVRLNAVKNLAKDPE